MARRKKHYDVYRRAPLACNECGRSNFLTSKGLAEHKRKAHSTRKSKAKRRGKRGGDAYYRGATLACPKCGREGFLTKRGLDEHIAKAHLRASVKKAYGLSKGRFRKSGSGRPPRSSEIPYHRRHAGTKMDWTVYDSESAEVLAVVKNTTREGAYKAAMKKTGRKTSDYMWATEYDDGK